MKERLQKLLSEAGICSRRKAEEYICAGRVKVNGFTAKLGDRADLAEDQVALDGKRLEEIKKTVWLMLHKPRGYVTTLSDEKGRKTAWELVKECGCRVWPVGRLDLDSEGLLLFTNDGEGTNRLLHPSHEVEKEYLVDVKGDIQAALPILRGRIELDGEFLSPAKVECLKENEEGGQLSVTIRQGKNRQVRRMCAFAGLKVTRLKRVREGEIFLGDLPVGKWRWLTKSELDKLRR